MTAAPGRGSALRYRSMLLALFAMASVQTGAGVSSRLFERFGPTGTAWLRLCWAAAVLWLVARPRLRGRPAGDSAAAALLGAISGLLTLLYFEAVVRVPLGTATALEFMGPLGVALIGLRRAVDLLWPLAAVGGVLALTRPWSGQVDLGGVGYGLGAAAGWAGYILLTKRVGERFTGLSGLALSMAAAAVVTTPFAHVTRVATRLDPPSLALSAVAALLLPVLPYAAEMVALRSLSTAVFGTLMSLEPAIGTLVGFVLLAQEPSWATALGVGLVTAAGIGAVRSEAHAASPRPAPPAPETRDHTEGPGMTTDGTAYRSLTPSGMGAELPHEDCPVTDLARKVKQAALTRGCALVRGLSLDEETFKQLVRGLGDTVDHKFGEGQADLLKLNASRDKDKVVTGRGPLPLHTDGLLVGERVDLIILYAAEFRDTPGSGETFVSDQLTAWAEMPGHLRGVLEEYELEYLVTERGYFPTVPEDWYVIPSTREHGGLRSLNLTTSFPADAAPRSWEIRVKGMAPERSDRFLAELDAYLRSERYSYQHRWQVGDLLVIDNQRTLHGRTSISDGGTRVLFRGQLTLARE